MYRVGVGAGIIPWPKSYGKYFLRDYTPKSVSLNLPLNTQIESIKGSELYHQYWNGLLSREGNNPLVYLNAEVEELKGGFNCMSFPNPGVKSILDEVLTINEVPIRLSIFGNNENELVRIIELTKNHEAILQIKSFEINVSCPNTKPGECASSNDINQITNYIKAVRSVTDKELIIKLSPLVNAADYIKAIIDSGADAINLGNTIPGRAYNKFTGELLMPVGGINGPIIFGRMLKNVSDTYQKMNELKNFIPIYASGGITNKKQALEAINAGATYIDLGYAFGKVNEEGIFSLVKEVEDYLSSFNIETIIGQKIITQNPPYWNNPKNWHVNSDGSKQLMIQSQDHKPLLIKEINPVSKDSYLIELNESINHEVGQYAGLMIKINGRFEERPFTFTKDNGFIIHNLREHALLNGIKISDDYGLLSNALCNLKPGSQVYVRAPLGNGIRINELKNTLTIGGGCGAAAIAELSEKIKCDTILSFSNEHEVMLEERLNEFIIRKHVDSINEGLLPVKQIKFSDYENLVLCGPNPMMFVCASEAVNQGMNQENIHLIMESTFKCFNGLCGACDCGGIRLCTQGPAIKYNNLPKEFIVRNKSGRIK